MVANFSIQEVLEMVARDKEMDVDVEEKANEEVTLTKRIKECLKGTGDAGIDIDFFVDTGVSMLVPLYDLSRRRVAGLPVKASQILNTQIQVGTIMRSESRLWLAGKEPIPKWNYLRHPLRGFLCITKSN